MKRLTITVIKNTTLQNTEIHSPGCLAQKGGLTGKSWTTCTTLFHVIQLRVKETELYYVYKSSHKSCSDVTIRIAMQILISINSLILYLTYDIWVAYYISHMIFEWHIPLLCYYTVTVALSSKSKPVQQTQVIIENKYCNILIYILQAHYYLCIISIYNIFILINKQLWEGWICFYGILYIFWLN